MNKKKKLLNADNRHDEGFWMSSCWSIDYEMNDSIWMWLMTIVDQRFFYRIQNNIGRCVPRRLTSFMNHALMNPKKSKFRFFFYNKSIMPFCPLMTRSNEEKLITIFDLFHLANDCAVEEQNIHALSTQYYLTNSNEMWNILCGK